jgi:hypothetical protein
VASKNLIVSTWRLHTLYWHSWYHLKRDLLLLENCSDQAGAIVSISRVSRQLFLHDSIKHQLVCLQHFLTTKTSENLLELDNLLRYWGIEMGNACSPNVFTPNSIVPGQSNAVIPMALELGYQRKDIDRMFKWVKSLYLSTVVLEMLFCTLDIFELTVWSLLHHSPICSDELVHADFKLLLPSVSKPIISILIHPFYKMLIIIWITVDYSTNWMSRKPV